MAAHEQLSTQFSRHKKLAPDSAACLRLVSRFQAKASDQDSGSAAAANGANDLSLPATLTRFRMGSQLLCLLLRLIDSSDCFKSPGVPRRLKSLDPVSFTFTHVSELLESNLADPRQPSRESSLEGQGR